MSTDIPLCCGQTMHNVYNDKAVVCRFCSVCMRAVDCALPPTVEELIPKVLAWAEARDIFAKSTPAKQHEKTEEEVKELGDAIADPSAFSESAIKDGIGDTTVTLILQAHMNGLTLAECLAFAYAEIADRKGKMVDGLFVKEDRK